MPLVAGATASATHWEGDVDPQSGADGARCAGVYGAHAQVRPVPCEDTLSRAAEDVANRYERFLGATGARKSVLAAEACVALATSDKSAEIVLHLNARSCDTIAFHASSTTRMKPGLGRLPMPRFWQRCGQAQRDLP